MTVNVLLAGCGDLGCEVARQLVSAGHQVTGLRRSDSALPDGVKAFKADVTRPETLEALAEVHPDILVYCVVADAHTDESYRLHYVDGLHNVLSALAESESLRHVFFVSSTGIYGQHSDDILDETVEPIPADFSGIRMRQAEDVLTTLAIPGTALRLSGIYGPGRNRMIRLARDPQTWPAHNRWTNRIHRDDAARFIAFLVGRVQQGTPLAECYLVTDSRPVAYYEVLLWLATQMGVSTDQVKTPTAGGAKRLSNARMLSTGFTLRYPDYASGYSSLLASEGTLAL